MIDKDERFKRNFLKVATEDTGEKYNCHEGELFLVSISYVLIRNGTIVISIHGQDLCVGLTFHHKMEEVTDKIIKLILEQEVISREWLKEIGFGENFKDSDYGACMKAVGVE